VTPQFQITANAVDLTAKIAVRLIRLRITDEVGVNSDQLQIDLDDRGAAIVLPPFGATIECSLGYKELGLSAMGRWIVDELEVEGPERFLAIRARSANTPASASNSNSTCISGLQARTNDTYTELTVAGIVAKIAARNHLGAAIDPVIGAIQVAHRAQTGQSDNEYLSVLLELVNAGWKVQGGRIVVFQHNAGVAPASAGTSKSIPAVNVTPSDCLRWAATLTRRSSHKRARARYHDAASGRDTYVEAVSDDATEQDTVDTDPAEYPNDSEALAAATSRVQRLDRGSELLRLTLQGNPVICSESPLILSGFRPEIDHAWVAVRVTHTLDQSGYATEVEAQKTLTQAAGYSQRQGLTVNKPK
jgi:phage protein D